MKKNKYHLSGVRFLTCDLLTKMPEKEIGDIVNLLQFIGKKWVLLIIKSISEGCMCFSEIEKTLQGINPRILSSRLKELEERGFVSSHIRANTKNKTVYCLTEKGICLAQNIKNLESWIKMWGKE